MDPEKLVLVIIVVLVIFVLVFVIADWLLNRQITRTFCLFIGSKAPIGIFHFLNPFSVICSPFQLGGAT